MPIFEYECPRCGYRTEQLVLNGEKIDEIICPKCGTPMVKVFSGSVGLVFKGSGFYITDYKNKEKKAQKSGGKSKDKENK